MCFALDNFQCIVQEEKGTMSERCLFKKEHVQKKIDEYVHSFTVHPLTKIITGNRFEAAFWFTVLGFGTLLASFIIHGRISKYYHYEIHTEISSKVTSKNSFPTITFCDAQFFRNHYFSYCKENFHSRGSNENNYCQDLEVKYPEITVVTDERKWSNGLFSVTQCATLDGKKCVNQMFLQSLQRYNHTCFSLNYRGDLHDSYGRLTIAFYIKNRNRNTAVFVYPHDPDELQMDAAKDVVLGPGKIYNIDINKSIIKRLPLPYPSNCTKEKSGDIFPGKYTRRSCLESHTYINLYKLCGDCYDYVRQYIPSKIKEKYHKKSKIKEVKNCLLEKSRVSHPSKANCPFPCESLELSVTTSFEGENHVKPPDNITNMYLVHVQLAHVDSVRTIEEKELYSSYQMLCEIGGFVGLVIGASLISFLEVITYIVLLTVKNTFK